MYAQNKRQSKKTKQTLVPQQNNDQTNCEITHTLTKALRTMLSEGSSRCDPSAITALDKTKSTAL